MVQFAGRLRESRGGTAVLPAFIRGATNVMALLGVLFPAVAASQENAAPAEVPRAPTVAEAEMMEARLQAAIQVNPTLAPLHASLGELYRSQARTLEARDAYAEAVRLEPMNPAYRIELGRAHLALDEFVDAEVNFEWGTQLTPEDPQMHIGLGEALLGLNRPQEAVAALQRASQLDPENVEAQALLSRAQLAARTGDAPTNEDPGIAAALVRGLTYLFAALLTIAGIGLLLPVGSAIVVLVFFLPRAILQRIKG